MTNSLSFSKKFRHPFIFCSGKRGPSRGDIVKQTQECTLLESILRAKKSGFLSLKKGKHRRNLFVPPCT